MFRRFNAVFVVVALGAVVVLAAPTQLDIDPASTPVPIIAQSENNNADGTFNYRYGIVDVHLSRSYLRSLSVVATKPATASRTRPKDS